MRENTPPRSPMDEHLLEYEDDDEEVILLGDADEVLDAWEAEANLDEDDEEAKEDDGGTVSFRTCDRDDAKLTFTKHTATVFCGALHPTEDLAITGGEDDKAYVWNIRSGEVQFEVTNHTDSVVAVGFSYDGVFAATADIAGYIQVFKVQQNYRKVWEFNVGDLCWMRWHSAAHVLLAGCDSGDVYVWRIPSGDCKVLPGQDHKTEAAELTHDGKKLAVGYGNGHFKLWDLKSGTPVMEVDATVGHKTNITTLSIDQENQLFVTGAEDGSSYVMGPNGVLGMLTGPSDALLEAVLIDYPGFEIKVAVTGTLQGKVTIWDVARQTKRVECVDEEPTGITRMVWLKDHAICAGTLGGLIKAWDFRSGAKRFTLDGHTNDIQDVVYDRERNIILSTSEDFTAKIFEVPASQ
ncbi:angio-associated migratory cell protein [Anopheles moucheti]|uniref:angio-associated migratory cell protein n=1 Tax=Anopheles moucheti TaxID=186751 RepID=UPI0022F019EA|nr:angio-associated migratory cell protein [Anopheles moucheti]